MTPKFLLLLLGLCALCLAGCFASPIELPQGMADRQGSPDSDLYYGLLVYFEQMDESLPLEERARFVRAVFRKEARSDLYVVSPSSGQVNAAKSRAAFVERVRRFGKVLRETMTESERAQFVKLIQEGYYYDVHADEVNGDIHWESRRGMKMRSPTPAEGSEPSQASRPRPRVAEPPEEDLRLPVSEAASLLAIDDRRLTRIVLDQLVEVPFEPEYSQEIGAAIWKFLDQQRLLSAESGRLISAYCRWASREEVANLEALLDVDIMMRWFHLELFGRLYELDRTRAAEFILEPEQYELATVMISKAYRDENKEEEWARDLPEILLQSNHRRVLDAVYRELTANGEPRHIPALREAAERYPGMTRVIEAIELRWSPEKSWGQVRRLVSELWPGYEPQITVVMGESIRFYLIDSEGLICTSPIEWNRPAHEDVTAEWIREEVRRAGGI